MCGNPPGATASWRRSTGNKRTNRKKRRKIRPFWRIFRRFAACGAVRFCIYLLRYKRFLTLFPIKEHRYAAAFFPADKAGLSFVPADFCRAAAAAFSGQHGPVHDRPFRLCRRSLHRQRQSGDERGHHRADHHEHRLHHFADAAHRRGPHRRGMR